MPLSPRVRVPALGLLLAALVAGAAACQRDMRSERLDHLQAKLAEDRAALQHDAETRDPSRPDLVASFVDSSIVQLRETANPKRPWVAYVRIRWHFAHKDGRQVGDALFDYVYALDPAEHWMKADEPGPGSTVSPADEERQSGSDGTAPATEPTHDKSGSHPVVLPPVGKPA